MKQKKLLKCWTKIELNSSYGSPTITNTLTLYDQNKAFHIKEIGEMYLTLIQDIYENIKLNEMKTHKVVDIIDNTPLFYGTEPECYEWKKNQGFGYKVIKK